MAVFNQDASEADMDADASHGAATFEKGCLPTGQAARPILYCPR